jgi:hypothetical protein
VLIGGLNMDSLNTLSSSSLKKEIDKLTDSDIKQGSWGGFGKRKIEIAGVENTFEELIQEVGKRKDDFTMEEMKECFNKIKTLDKKTQYFHQIIFGWIPARKEKAIHQLLDLKKTYDSLPTNAKIVLQKECINSKETHVKNKKEALNEFEGILKDDKAKLSQLKDNMAKPISRKEMNTLIAERRKWENDAHDIIKNNTDYGLDSVPNSVLKAAINNLTKRNVHFDSENYGYVQIAGKKENIFFIQLIAEIGKRQEWFTNDEMQAFFDKIEDLERDTWIDEGVFESDQSYGARADAFDSRRRDATRLMRSKRMYDKAPDEVKIKRLEGYIKKHEHIIKRKKQSLIKLEAELEFEKGKLKKLENSPSPTGNTNLRNLKSEAIPKS